LLPGMRALRDNRARKRRAPCEDHGRGSHRPKGESAMDDAPRELRGRPADLAGLTEYQQGSVVSRTVIDKPVGTVTLFAFDQGEGLSEHTAPYDALVTVVDGEAEVVLAGQAHRVRHGEMIIMPAGVPHALRAVARFKMMLVMIRA
jgi:quercetin dioxygenase-like cupin family protein